MATAAELQARLDKLDAARTSGLLTVEFDGRRVTYRNDSEMAAAIGYVRRQLDAERVTTIVFTTSKGLS